MSGDQLEQRIRASLSHRAEAVRVQPDLADLAEQAGPGRIRAQRFPLVAVAIAVAALAVSTVALEPALGGDAHLLSRARNRTETTDEPTSTTDRPGPTSAPKRPRTTTTATSTPTTSTTVTQATPDGTGAGSADGTPEGQTGPDQTADAGAPGAVSPSPECVELGGPVVHRGAWSQDSHLVLVDLGEGGTGSTRRIALYMTVEPAGDADCYRRITDPFGTPTELEVATTADSDREIHTVGCQNPVLKIADASTTDGVTWTIRVRDIEIMAFMARTTMDATYTEDDDPGYVDSLRALDCDDATPI